MPVAYKQNSFRHQTHEHETGKQNAKNTYHFTFTQNFSSAVGERGDISTEAMKEIGVTDRAQDDAGWEMFDGVKFDPKGDLEAYAKGFPVNSAKG